MIVYIIYCECLDTLEILRVSCKLSSSYHPQIDGQTKGTSQTLEQYHRCLINYQQDDWTDFLRMVEFAYNTIHSLKQRMPFSFDDAQISNSVKQSCC